MPTPWNIATKKAPINENPIHIYKCHQLTIVHWKVQFNANTRLLPQ